MKTHDIISEKAGGVFGREPSRLGAAAVIAVLGMLQPATPHTAFCAEAQKPSSRHSFSISDITTEWWSRESRFGTAQMSWHVVRDPAKGPNNFQVEFPQPADRQHPSAGESFWLSGNRIRHEARRWHAELEREFAGYDKENLFAKYVEAMRRGEDDVTKWDRLPYHFRLVRDQDTHRELLDGVAGAPPLGTIRDSSRSLSLSAGSRISAGLIFWPALMAMRPTLALGVTPPNHGFVVQNESSTIGRHHCIVVADQSGAAATLRLWVVPDEGFSIVRAMAYAEGRIREQIDIEYAHDQQAGWFPRAWSIMVFNSEGKYPGQAEVFRSVHIGVDSHKINGPVDSGLFNVEFPINTLVNDKTSNKTYVVLEGGASRPATSGELRLLSGKAEPDLPESRFRLSPNAKICGGLAIALGTLWALRRRRMSALSIKHTT